MMDMLAHTLLYADGGKEKAEKEGRKSWHDAGTQRITITAYSVQVEAVREYLRSLPEFDQSAGFAPAGRAWFRSESRQANPKGIPPDASGFASVEQSGATEANTLPAKF
ncbi:hypothetical protein IT570_14330 [Candidatus Sumerlaeota bacterium]|nr:hypothetical protein [Candidatus Sumerlaeota bacterium]